MIRRLQVNDPRLSRVRAAIRMQPRARATAFVLIAGLLTAFALLFAPPATVTYDVGKVADRAIRAPRSVSFVSPSLTGAERDKAVAAVPKQFATDPAIVVGASSRLNSAIGAIARVRSDAVQTRDQKLSSLARLTEAQITPALAVDIVDMPPLEWDQLAGGLDSALRTLYGQGIRAEQLDAVKTDAVKALPGGWTPRQKNVGAELIRQNLSANVNVDQQATILAQQDARTGVVPVQVQVTAGEVVVREGDVVTALQVEKLRALGLSNQGVDWRSALGLILWAGLHLPDCPQVAMGVRLVGVSLPQTLLHPHRLGMVG